MTRHTVPVRTLAWGNAVVFLIVFGLLAVFPAALQYFELKTVDSRFQIRDALGMNPAENPVHVHDFQATLLHLLGIDHERFTYKFQGRRYRLTDVHGKVVKGVLA